MMRMLIFHVDGFATEPEDRGRSTITDETPRAVRIQEGIVVFAACEKADEAEPEAVATRATAAIADIARRLGARTVVLHSFAHLFVELSAPAVARSILNEVQRQLEAQGLATSQTAFGYFNRLELRAKGHPLSRVARQV
jgi:threonyl-tRNA synthetase